MAQPALEKFIRRNLMLKVQASEGTPVTPSTSTDGIRLYDGASGVEHDEVTENIDKAFFSGPEIATTNHRAFITGGLRLYPPAVPGHAADGIPDCDLPLRLAGMTRVLDAPGKTTRFNPISAGMPVATAYWSHAGTQKQVFDARAAISALSMQIGERYQAQLRVQGSYNDVAETALPAVTLPSGNGPVITAANSIAQLTILPGGDPLNVWAKSLAIDFGNQLRTKEYTEKKINTIDDRQATWTMRLARTAKSDFDPWALLRNGTFIQASMRVTGAANLYAEHGIRGQIRGVSEVDIDGDYGWELSGYCVASAAGGDEFWIEFGDSTP